MGQIFSCCKPKKVQYNKINGKVSVKETSHVEVEEYNFKAYREGVLTAVEEVVRATVVDPSYCSRTLGDIFDLNYDAIDQDLADLPGDFLLYAEEISDEELEYILNSCSNSPMSGTFDVDMESPFLDTNSDNMIERLLSNNTHIALCQSADDFPKLKELLTNASQMHIIGDYIDNVDANGNTALSVALLSSNDNAFLCLIMTFLADIPLHINVEGKQYLFLIYLILHNNNARERSTRKCFLHIVLQELKKRSLGDEYLRKYLKAIDPTLKLSLLHFLVEAYLMGQSRIVQIYNCIKLCINLLPEGIYIKCQINRHTQFELNVICRILCCANLCNIIDVVQIIDDIKSIFPQIIKEGHQLYRQIIEAHNTVEIRNRLLPLFVQSD